MGRFHVGAAEDEHDEHDEHCDGDESSTPVVAVSASSNATVEAMDCSGNKPDGGVDADTNTDGDEVEAELVGSEPWEDRCYADAPGLLDNGRDREPVSTPPGAAAVVPCENGHHSHHPDGDNNHEYDHEQDDYADPDRAAAEELAAQMDQQYMYEQELSLIHI